MNSSPPALFQNLTPAAELIGRRFVSFDSEVGHLVLAFQARPEFANRHGTVQGGFLAAMLDSATTMALIAVLPDGMTAVTKRIDTTFVKPAPVGDFLASARVISRSDRDAEAQGELATPEGVIVATATAYLRIRPRS